MMRHLTPGIFAVGIVLGLIAGWSPVHVRAQGAQAAAAAKPVAVVMETPLGTIEIEVDVARAPATAANFLRYVDAGLYDGGNFHRAVRPDTELRTDYPIQVIQGRMNQARAKEGFPAIKMETTATTGLKHDDGALSMARSGPDTATHAFFVAIGPQPELDFRGRRNADGQGFAVFGRVTRGMDIVKQIQAGAVRPGTETLETPVVITRVRRR